VSDITIAAKADLDSLAARIKQEHTAAEGALRSGLAHALEAGRLLLEAKRGVGHGEWLRWVQDQCGLSERLAQKYMQVARELPQLDEANTPRVAGLTFRQALDLLAQNARQARRVPLEDRATVIDRASEQRTTVLSEMVVAHREGKARRRDEQRRRQEAVQREEHRILHEDELPAPRVHAGPISLWGLPEDELAVILDELVRSMDWYDRLARKLESEYNRRVPYLADQVVNSIRELHRRLEYDQRELAQAVYWIRDALGEGPQTGKEIRRRARKANIADGLLRAARHVALTVGILTVRSTQGQETWSLGDWRDTSDEET
jgi:hypothetical protein